MTTESVFTHILLFESEIGQARAVTGGFAGTLRTSHENVMRLGRGFAGILEGMSGLVVHEDQPHLSVTVCKGPVR